MTTETLVSKHAARRLVIMRRAGPGQWVVIQWSDGYRAWCNGPTKQYFEAVATVRQARYTLVTGNDGRPPDGWRC